jgi:hypothetical protein
MPPKAAFTSTTIEENHMTKRNFEILAEEISKLLSKKERLAAAVAVAGACVRINPNFDSAKFFKACGV